MDHERLDALLQSYPGCTKDFKAEWQWWRYQVGGKTGSAEVSSNKSVKTHSWFTGFVADDEHPLAVTVILEQAGGGASAAAPLAGQLLKKAIKLGY